MEHNDNIQDTETFDQEELETAEFQDDQGTASDVTINLRQYKKEAWSWFMTFAAAAALFAILFIFMAPGVVSGSSMNPNYYDGDRFLLIRDWLITDYDYGDVVCIKQDNSILIKRIIGKPGDHISIHDGYVFRNDQMVVEHDYINQVTVAVGEYKDIVLKEGEYYLLGDNRGGSIDSRIFGPCSNIEGKTFFFFRRVWFK